jgi:hypothetical protein
MELDGEDDRPDIQMDGENKATRKVRKKRKPDPGFETPPAKPPSKARARSAGTHIGTMLLALYTLRKT